MLDQIERFYVLVSTTSCTCGLVGSKPVFFCFAVISQNDIFNEVKPSQHHLVRLHSAVLAFVRPRHLLYIKEHWQGESGEALRERL